jgi:hypothetical protein
MNEIRRHHREAEEIARIHQDLLAEVDHHYPYYRFANVEQASPTAS